MNLYAESSAVLAWLLANEHGETVRDFLSRSEAICASDLTLLECERVLVRAMVDGRLSEADAGSRSARLASAAGHWTILRIGDDVLERARRRFPVEPLRTLDAVHLASALVLRRAFPDLLVLSLDHRVRQCADALGLRIEPAIA